MQLGLTRAVLLAHGYRCRYCGDVADSADHIVPRAVGGSDAPKNLTASCRPCNGRKGGARLSDTVLERELLVEAHILAPFIYQAVSLYRRAVVSAERMRVRAG